MRADFNAKTKNGREGRKNPILRFSFLCVLCEVFVSLR